MTPRTTSRPDSKAAAVNQGGRSFIFWAAIADGTATAQRISTLYHSTWKIKNQAEISRRRRSFTVAVNICPGVRNRGLTDLEWISKHTDICRTPRKSPAIRPRT